MRTAASKIETPEGVAVRVDRARAAGRHVALASGRFELLQPGLVRALADAKGAGDVLVVALLSDPAALVADAERALLVAALRAVDHVAVVAPGELPALLARLRPDAHVPEGDAAETRALLERLRR
jgi:bifunctional ADP-heptose synthase (sugar kinase/adenylyltransferase)